MAIRLITRNAIQDWAKSAESKTNLPILMSQLVHATANGISYIDFPSGSAAYIGGWDGKVKCNEDSPYVPKGISLWEFGTEANAKGKADEDYAKRTADPLGEDTTTSTFIFVTPHFWKFKNRWVQSKLKENKWKDIKVYDSSNLEQWMDIAPAVSRWFSVFVQGWPNDGILTVDRFWLEWSFGPKGRELPPSIVTAGRENESKQLLNFLNKGEGIKAIRASSKDEAIAFMIASAKQFEQMQSNDFFSKSLIVDNEANFRMISINKTSLNIISRIEKASILYGGVKDGHHILVPLGADDPFDQETITLPALDREGQIKALVGMGLSEEEATKYSKEAGRNITVLKRLLKFSQDKLEWTKAENIREIIPAMLLGRWDENKKGDRQIIEKLSGIKYDEYIARLAKWRDIEAAPFIQIGNMWRLTSPMDAWANLSQHVLKSDIEMLHESFFFALKNGNPIVESDQNMPVTKYYAGEKAFSNWAREGLIQSLILIGLYGEGLKIPNMDSPQLWVDSVIGSLLKNADGKLWISLNQEMPLIAEASPDSFFEAIYTSLSEEKKPIMAMFIEEEGIITSVSNHAGLLWALEELAWSQDYLYNATLILSKLAALDPGGSWSNRPINSLTEIFKPWHYQTFASIDERMSILKQVATKEKEIIWLLLLRMLPNEIHEIAHPIYKMRWRMFDKSYNKIYYYQEIWDTRDFVVDLLISMFDYSEEKFSQLIEKSFNKDFKIENRNKILEFAKVKYSEIKQVNYTSWHTLRKIISHQRSHPTMQWALPKEELAKYEELYTKLEPTDEIQKYSWLFDEHTPQFEEGYNYEEKDYVKSHLEQQSKIEGKRIEGLNIILTKYGIEKIKDLSKTVKFPSSLGDTLAKIIKKDSDIFSVFEILKTEASNLDFVYGFIYRMSIIHNLEWIFSLYEKLLAKNYDNKAIAQLFIPLNQSKQLWEFIDSTNEEIKQKYWLSVRPHFYPITKEEKILGIKHLLNYKRFFSTLDMSANFPDEIPTELIIIVLTSAATIEANEKIRWDGYEIGRLFETLDKRKDIDHKTLIQLEWLYMPLLDTYASRDPKTLHDELASNPEFFIDILKWAYKPKNELQIEEERMGLSDEDIQNRGMQAYRLLHSWKKVPGVNDDGTINEDILTGWVKKVRELAEKVGRLEVADMQIGYILAQYPEKKDVNWPPDKICDIIEAINNDRIKSSFSTATFNKRGSSSRGPFEGGQIERGHAEYFEKLAAIHKNKFPIVAGILARLAKGYRLDAKRMDEEAIRDKLEY